MAERPSSVLFACNFNSIRSPIAEALLRHLHGRRIHVASVGLREAPVDPFAIAVMDEIGIDLRRHQPRSFDELEEGWFDLVISLSPEAHHRALELTRTMDCELEYWPVHDPSTIEGSRAEILAAYRLVRDHLQNRIRLRFPLPPSAGV